MPEILIRSYGLREDSGGPGRHRGGTGIELELETRSPYTTVTARNMERYLFPPPGRLGGWPGTTGYTTVNPGSAAERDIGKIDVLHLEPGERLRIGTQGAADSATPWTATRKRCARTCATASSRRRTATNAYGVILDAEDRVDGRRHRGETGHASGRARLDRAARLLLRGSARGLRAALDRVPAGRAAGGNRPPSGAAPPSDAPAPRAGHRGTPRGRRTRRPERSAGRPRSARLTLTPQPPPFRAPPR